MGKQLVKDLKDGDYVSSCFQVENVQQFEFKNKPGIYVLFDLSDRTGTLRGVCWEKGEEVAKMIDQGAIAFLEGRVVTYSGRPQINVNKIEIADEKEIDPSDFLPVGQQDVEELYRIILDAIEGIKNPHLKGLLESFFKDPGFEKTFKRCPAAKAIHHNYLGGLAEHTANCVRIAQCICDIYPGLKRDLLIAGTILHDLGKTVEIASDVKIDYTDEGRLLGHIVIGERIIHNRILEMPDFPESLRFELCHLIVSHHGETSTGSPKRPKMPESCALHFLENLDAQTKRFLQLVETTQGGSRKGWAGYDRLLERYIYRGYDEPAE